MIWICQWDWMTLHDRGYPSAVLSNSFWCMNPPKWFQTTKYVKVFTPQNSIPWLKTGCRTLWNTVISSKTTQHRRLKAGDILASYAAVSIGQPCALDHWRAAISHNTTSQSYHQWAEDQMLGGDNIPLLPPPDLAALTSVINACGMQIQWESWGVKGILRPGRV